MRMFYWVRMEKYDTDSVEQFFDYTDKGREEFSDFVFSYMANGWRIDRAEVRNGSGIIW